MTLTDIKTYLRIDGNDSDAEISALMLAAAGYIKRITGKTKIIVAYDLLGVAITNEIDDDALFSLACKLLISHWFENRGVEIAGQLTKITHSVDALVNHISMSIDYI